MFFSPYIYIYIDTQIYSLVGNCHTLQDRMIIRSHRARLHEVNKVWEEHVAIALTESVDIVRDLAGIMVNNETRTNSLKVIMRTDMA